MRDLWSMNDIFDAASDYCVVCTTIECFFNSKTGAPLSCLLFSIVVAFVRLCTVRQTLLA